MPQSAAHVPCFPARLAGVPAKMPLGVGRNRFDPAPPAAARRYELEDEQPLEEQPLDEEQPLELWLELEAGPEPPPRWELVYSARMA